MQRKPTIKNVIRPVVPAAVGALFLVFAAWFVIVDNQGYKEQTLTHFRNVSRLMKQVLEQSPSNTDFVNINRHFLEFMRLETDMLYFVLTDADGIIRVTDDTRFLGKKHFETAEIIKITSPLIETLEAGEKGHSPSRFMVYESRMSWDVEKENVVRARKDQVVYDLFWDVIDAERTLANLRVGFSKQKIKTHVYASLFLLLLCCMAALFSFCSVLLWYRNKHSQRMQHMTRVVSQMHHHPDSSGFEIHPEDTVEDTLLKQAVLNFRIETSNRIAALESRSQEMEKQREQTLEAYARIRSDFDKQSLERREMETRMLNAQKLEAVGTLAGGVAHEFNNLFMAITGYASLILRQSDRKLASEERAAKILKLVNTGSQSIKQLLGFARSGKYTPCPLNLNEVIRINLEMFEKTRKDLVIKAKYTSDIWSVQADRSQMDHVIMNLLINASEAMPSEGVIIVETSNIVLEKRKVGINKVVSGRFVRFSVEDQGKGIETKYLRRIFDPFFTTKPLSAGAGLGLASVYGIVDNHDGFTTVETAIGKGSVFNVFLPAIKEEKRESDVSESI